MKVWGLNWTSYSTYSWKCHNINKHSTLSLPFLVAIEMHLPWMLCTNIPPWLLLALNNSNCNVISITISNQGEPDNGGWGAPQVSLQPLLIWHTISPPAVRVEKNSINHHIMGNGFNMANRTNVMTVIIMILSCSQYCSFVFRTVTKPLYYFFFSQSMANSHCAYLKTFMEL